MKIHMLPATSDLGIGRVVDAYRKHLPKFGVEFTSEEAADLIICHAGEHAKKRQTDILICHGLYPTATLDTAAMYFDTNAAVIRNAREAKVITVPSNWVAMPFKRDMAIAPYVVPHGIEFEDWPTRNSSNGYALWAKGHTPGVCNPDVVNELASIMPTQEFITTFGKPSSNVRVVGMQKFPDMKKLLAEAGVYLATSKETFGIQTLEAMACGVPVVGYKHGATPDLVVQGVTGWLVAPGDLQGLAEGVRWALSANRWYISQESRERAKQFTWDAACKRLFDVMKIANTQQAEPMVSVVIPSYNYGKWVGKAIESVLGQTYTGHKEIIVVDDGSNDNTEQVVKLYANKVTYFKNKNAGVAEARNFGIRHATGELIACLDADDYWEPEFLSSLLPAMDDRSLGLVYGHLQSTNGTGIHRSDWPPQFDFKQQSTRHNCVPSACLFRKTAWERAGGFRAQYTPAEDAELWLRIAAVGFNVRKITDKPVYTYRLHGDSLSRSMQEPNWASDKPYSSTEVSTPFAAPVNIKDKASNPFRDYDDPWVSVIIPVGPGHENLVYRALDSLQTQSVLNWEVIVVNDSGTDLMHPPTGKPLGQVYPYIIEVNSGRSGVATARNMGVDNCNSDMLIFLDADDWLLPEFMSHVIHAYNENPDRYIYTDWLGLDDKKKTSPRLSKEFSIKGILAEALHPITTLVPRTWHVEIGGFDTTVSGWEDWIYYLDLVKAGHCGLRLGIQGMVYDYASGLRREDSLKNINKLLPVVRKRYKESDMACSSCGKRNGGGTRSSSGAIPIQQSRSAGGVPVMATREVSTSKMIVVKENSGNIGAHGVVGARTRINYGRHKHGDVFEMHRDDAMAQPQRYVRMADDRVGAPAPEKPIAPQTVVSVAPPVEPIKPEVVKKALEPIPDNEVEVDITLLPLVQIKRLELSTEDAGYALEQERASDKPRQSVINYLETVVAGK